MVAKDIDPEKLKAACLVVVREGDLDKLTGRIVRRKIEKRLGLDEESLDQQPYKQIVKDAVDMALQGLEKASERQSLQFKDAVSAPAEEEEEKDEKEEKEEGQAEQNSNDSDDGSELSEVIDDEPLPEKQRKRTTKSASPQKAKRARSDTKLSKGNETTISNLKSYISKCGMRKVWSKELAGMNAAQQIRHLKQMLADLGMDGRPTLEKCKKIKAKRDLLAEMEEMNEANIIDDVAPAESARSRRRAAAAHKRISYNVDEISDSEGEDEGAGAAADGSNEPGTRGSKDGYKTSSSDDGGNDQGESDEDSRESDAYTEDEGDDGNDADGQEAESSDEQSEADFD